MSAAAVGAVEAAADEGETERTEQLLFPSSSSLIK